MKKDNSVVDEKTFINADGIVFRWVKKEAEKEAVMQYLQTKFEVGKHYTEREVNDILKMWHSFNDHALLRRELFDRRYLERTADCREYWREM